MHSKIAAKNWKVLKVFLKLILQPCRNFKMFVKRTKDNYTSIFKNLGYDMLFMSNMLKLYTEG